MPESGWCILPHHLSFLAVELLVGYQNLQKSTMKRNEDSDSFRTYEDTDLERATSFTSLPTRARDIQDGEGNKTELSRVDVCSNKLYHTVYDRLTCIH